MMPNRRIAGKEMSRDRVAVQAASGSPNAIPHNVATGIAGIRPHDRVSGNTASTTATPVAPMAVRVAWCIARPVATSPGSIGVDTIAWYACDHMKPSIVGHSASWLAVNIAVVARSAVA